MNVPPDVAGYAAFLEATGTMPAAEYLEGWAPHLPAPWGTRDGRDEAEYADEIAKLRREVTP